MTIGPIEIAIRYRCGHIGIVIAHNGDDHREHHRRASEILCEVCEAERLERHRRHRIHRFTISQTGDTTMSLTPFTPGSTAGFTAIPNPSDATPAEGNPVNWTSSDPVNAPVTANPSDPTGLTASVTFPTDAVVGTGFVLTAEYLNADAVVASGSFSGTIVEPAPPPPPPVTDIVSFTIEQTS